MSKKTKESIELEIEHNHKAIDEIIEMANNVKLGVDICVGILNFAKSMTTTIFMFDLTLSGSSDLNGSLVDLVKKSDGNAIAIASYALSTILREAAYNHLPGYHPDFEASAKLTRRNMSTMIRTVKGSDKW